MLILPFAIALGVVAGWALGGRLRGLRELSLRHVPLVLGALVLQVVAAEVPARGASGGMRLALVVVSYVLAGAWLLEQAWRSRGALRAGIALVAVGWLANFVAIAANGGMPVSSAALRAAGLRAALAVEDGHLGKHVHAGRHTVLGVLGDVIPLRVFAAAVSVGDLVMVSGVVVAVVALMRSARGRPGRLAAPADAPRARQPAL